MTIGTTGLTWHEVVSSNIDKLAYSPEERALYIVFKIGGTYAYYGVSKHVFEDMLNAASVGKYFHANIRDQYDTRKL